MPEGDGPADGSRTSNHGCGFEGKPQRSWTLKRIISRFGDTNESGRVNSAVLLGGACSQLHVGEAPCSVTTTGRKGRQTAE